MAISYNSTSMIEGRRRVLREVRVPGPEPTQQWSSSTKPQNGAVLLGKVLWTTISDERIDQSPFYIARDRVRLRWSPVICIDSEEVSESMFMVPAAKSKCKTPLGKMARMMSRRVKVGTSQQKPRKSY